LEKTKNQHFRGKRREGIGSGLWWSITTLSTVGYGDKVPVSGVGRFFAGTWMILSLILVAIFTATVTSSITAHDASVEVNGPHDLPRARVGIVENGLASAYVNDHFLPHVSYPHLSLAVEQLRVGNLDAVLADQHSLERLLSEIHEDRIKLLENPVSKSPVSFGLRRTLSRDLIRRFDAALVARLEHRAPSTPAAAIEPLKNPPQTP
jgi:ABC-type amino acid transport substrate-binding protein